MFTGCFQTVVPSGQPSPGGRAAERALKSKRWQGQKWPLAQRELGLLTSKLGKKLRNAFRRGSQCRIISLVTKVLSVRAPPLGDQAPPLDDQAPPLDDSSAPLITEPLPLGDRAPPHDDQAPPLGCAIANPERRSRLRCLRPQEGRCGEERNQ